MEAKCQGGTKFSGCHETALFLEVILGNFNQATSRVRLVGERYEDMKSGPSTSRDGGEFVPIVLGNMRTLLGWSLIGPVLPSAGITLAVHHVTTADEVLEHNVKRLWQLDAIPPPNPSGVSMSKEDRYALLVMKQSTSKVNGHYQISLPWRPHGDTLLINNRQLAKTRLNHLQKRFDKDKYLKAK